MPGSFTKPHRLVGDAGIMRTDPSKQHSLI
jgi:hypothetical protein